MKKRIFRRLTLTIVVCAIIISALNYLLQTENARTHMKKKSLIKLNQIEEILEANAEEIDLIQDELTEDYIIRAKTVAYMIEHHPEYGNNLEELRRIAELLQVDELHLFNKDGVIYSGTEPKYYGLTMYDGEQIGFFLPMLEDTSLELVQDMTPNTAESKVMQYAAVWQEDEERIVQIGMQPERLLEAMEKNELSYIFSKVTPEADTIIYAVDKETGSIVACTEKSRIGLDAASIGLSIPANVSPETGFSIKIDGEDNHCIFEELGDQYIGITQAESKMYENVRRSVTLLTIYLVVISGIMILAIMMQLDKLIIQGIKRVNKTLAEITRGNLDVVVDERSIKEFSVLSDNINTMVSSVLDTTNTLSRLFESADVEMGVYEYYGHMKRVLVTQKTTSLMELSEIEKKAALSDKAIFEDRLNEIRKNPLEDTKDVFLVPGEGKRYVRLKSFEKEGTTYGVIVDETEDILAKQKVEYERDSDMLTGLYSRRAFFKKAEKLFDKPEILKNAVILMADVDYLKTANDTYGHGFGDRLIASAAELFKNSKMPHTLAVRLSGDEFALLIYGADYKQELEEEVQRIYKVMMKKTIKTPDGADYPVRLSAGYVFYPQQVHSFDELMHYADNAMYRVKRKNKANFMEYDSTMDMGKEK